MSYGFALATVIVSVATSILAGIILGVIEERSDGISLALLAFAARLQPLDEREEFVDEALGNLAALDGRYRTMGHAVGLVLASVRIRRVWHREIQSEPVLRSLLASVFSASYDRDRRRVMAVTLAAVGSVLVAAGTYVAAASSSFSSSSSRVAVVVTVISAVVVVALAAATVFALRGRHVPRRQDQGPHGH